MHDFLNMSDTNEVEKKKARTTFHIDDLSVESIGLSKINAPVL